MSLLHPPLLCVGITGGIGSGKSYICHRLEQAGHPVFYCDDEAKRIIRTDEEVKAALRRVVGPEVYRADGQLVKSVLAAYLCQGREYAARIDAIVHPRVAQAFRSRAARLARQLTDDALTPPAQWAARFPPKDTDCLHYLLNLPARQVFFMECALLFEARFEQFVDRSVLVHVSQDTQISRLMARDHISREQALAWIALQLPEEEKLRRADSLIHNG